MKKSNYIGLACTGHDNALAIVNSKGDLVFAEAAERYLQNKRAMNSPPDDLLRVGKLIAEYCESDCDIVIAKSWSESAIDTLNIESELAGKIIELSTDAPIPWITNFAVLRHIVNLVLPNIVQAGTNILGYCAQHPNRSATTRSYNHHFTHAAAGAFTSPFSEAVCAVVDGMGEGATLDFYGYKGNKFNKLGVKRTEPGAFASLGLFYGLTLCRLCGFSAWKGEEWKVMGLAAYGKEDSNIHRIMQNCLRVKGLELIFPDSASTAFGELENYARKPDASAETVADLAYTGQLFFSELMTQLLNNLYDLGVSDNLILSGGCALNSAYIGKILEQTKFKNLHVYSAPADDGNAVGAAYLAYYEDNPDKQPVPHVQSPYIGSRMSEETISNLQQFGRIKNAAKHSSTEIAKKTASLLADGKIIGWVQGQAEFGPRALGNRSILADPRDPEMKDKINSQVKFREEFRPFAPSILHEHGDDYFENYQESPYMERTLNFQKSVRNKVPAVVHEDGTGRLQTVKKEWNKDYHALINEFYKITGVPLLLNTSFNIMGKPIIHSVEDAIAVFYTTGLDALVIGNYIIQKEDS